MTILSIIPLTIFGIVVGAAAFGSDGGPRNGGIYRIKESNEVFIFLNNERRPISFAALIAQGIQVNTENVTEITLAQIENYPVGSIVEIGLITE